MLSATKQIKSSVSRYSVTFSSMLLFMLSLISCIPISVRPGIGRKTSQTQATTCNKFWRTSLFLLYLFVLPTVKNICVSCIRSCAYAVLITWALHFCFAVFLVSNITPNNFILLELFWWGIAYTALVFCYIVLINLYHIMQCIYITQYCIVLLGQNDERDFSKVYEVPVVVNPTILTARCPQRYFIRVMQGIKLWALFSSLLYHICCKLDDHTGTLSLYLF